MTFPMKVGSKVVNSKMELRQLAETDPIAQNLLTRAFFEGDGFPKDPKKAFYYACLGAEQKYSQSVLDLAYLYRKGIGCERDLLKAEQLYLEAERLGDDEAYNSLAEMYLFGMGPVKQDLLRGLDYVQKGIQSSCGMHSMLEVLGFSKEEFEFFYEQIKEGNIDGDELDELASILLKDQPEEYRVYEPAGLYDK